MTLAAVAKYPCKHGCLARCFAGIKKRAASNWIYAVSATRSYLLYIIIWLKIKGDFTQKIHPLYLYNMHKPLLSVHLNTAQSPPETALMLPFPDQQEQSVHDARFNPAKQAAVKCFPVGYFKPASRFLQAAPTKTPYRSFPLISLSLLFISAVAVRIDRPRVSVGGIAVIMAIFAAREHHWPPRCPLCIFCFH